MSDAVQIFDMSEVIPRANLARNAKMINVYANHLDNTNVGRAVLTFRTTRTEGEPWNIDDLNYIQSLQGKYTLAFMPQKEYMYIQSGLLTRPGYTIPMNGFYTVPGQQNELGNQYQDAGQMELIKRVLELERENERLNNELIDALEDLKQFETLGGKFAFSLEQMFFSIAPKLGIKLDGLQTPGNQYKPQNTQPMNGLEWQQIDVSGDTEQHVENALIVLVEAFGPDFVLKFARTIQQDPNKVQTLKNFM